jgi:hypothetical protein
MARGAKILLYLVYCVAVIVLVGFIAQSFRSNKATPKTPAAARRNQTTVTSRTPPTAQPSKSSTPAPQSPPAASTPGATALANSGPGDVVGLFVGVSVAGAVVYRRRLINQLS